MVFEHIEKLKQEYTDKYVVVDDSLPELQRFRGLTGTVRTVNMSGRALVEFDGFSNTGWYDIDVDFLKVIDQPLPKPDSKPVPKGEAKPAKPAATKAAKAPSELERARGEKPAAKPGAGKSVADVLAAARGQAPGKAGETAPAPPAKPSAKADPKSMSAADVLAAARAEKGGAAAPAAAPPASQGDARKTDVQQQLEAARRPKGTSEGKASPAAKSPAAKPAKVDPKQMSVEEMLAYARGEKGGSTAPAPPQSADEADGATEPDEAPEAAPETPASSAPEPVDEPAAGGEVVSKKDQITSLEDILAYCRQVDGG